ncbi:MAG TPA: WcaF family extracellular polysaccharide biosynthesis acetyltransferase [Candidatus Limnocylindria bacterium]|jgi:putative colanic acid biosynthesis acetyltransferase WcaF|nr:WcaF family extracellular polysaccharide biosynthesis acetyltransferase [Candidatus Limnocylindria bacterium]HEX3287763.1 WcaF family extracellular polysaccharide biosynthesis acetyltransferase [Mycobacterium sp.]
MTRIDLGLTSSGGYTPGRSLLARALWLVVDFAVFLNPIVTSYSLKRTLLRVFGAKIGRKVIIKPGVHIKHPWRLEIGARCWIGERVWIDNLESVRIGSDVVISQGAYVCTGNHDWSDPGMALVVQPISVGDGAWLCAFSSVGPGVTVAAGAVLTLGSVLVHDAEPMGVYRGNPAKRIGERRVRTKVGDPKFSVR